MKKTLVCLTAHHEGELLGRAYESVKAASLPIAFQQGLRVVVVADSPNDKTLSVAKSLGCEVFEVNHSDVGPARNWAMERFADEFDYIVFLDGDDMWSADFLSNAIFVASKASDAVIVSPKHRCQFWGQGRVRKVTFSQPTITSRNLSRLTEVCRATNLWGSTFLISSEAAKTLRFRSEKDGYGFEDWWFSVDSLEAGVERLTASGVHCYRQRLGSRRRIQSKTRVSMPATETSAAQALTTGSVPSGPVAKRPLRNPGSKSGKKRPYWGLIVLLIQFRPWIRPKLPSAR